MVDYFNRQMLAKLGYTFSGENLEPWEIQSYNIIGNTLDDLRDKEMKLNAKKKPRR